jgi:tripartite-type tricarboxylate transporter receptor subunit TctC
MSTQFLMLPPQTPAPRDWVKRLAAAMPEAAKKFQTFGVVPAPSSPEAFRDFIREDQHRWSKVIKEAKISLD